MTRTACASFAKMAMLTFVAAMLLTVLVPSEAGADEGFSSTIGPCPNFSVQDVLDNPNGDWDHDGRTNKNELYGGTMPCFNESGILHYYRYSDGYEPHIVCPANGCYVTVRTIRNHHRGHHNYTYTRHHYRPVQQSLHVCIGGHWNQAGVNNNPNGDADGDGVSNIHEVNGGANPCAKPCNNPKTVDYRLNPNGDWDRDGYSNNHEWVNRTNACSSHSYNPCPNVPSHGLRHMPSADWDHDGTHNQYDPSPCVKNQRVVTYVPQVTYIPQVTYVPAPQPVPAVQCPHGFPYYHPVTRQCHANPIGNY